MASVFSEITSNIETTLHGKSITYGGLTKTTTCEQERFINIIGNRFPFILLSGPIVEVLSRAHGVVHCTLHYLVTLVDNTVNDEYDPDVTVQPIAKVTKDIAADLIKLVMASRGRGGYSNNTEWSGAGYYFDNDGDTPLFNVYVQLEVKAIVRDTDPYFTGG